MSVYNHPTKPGWQMIKISHGRKGKPEYIPYPGGRDDALMYERELRGLTDTTDPGFLDKLPEFRIAYKNEVMESTYGDFEWAWKQIEPFFDTMKIRHITPVIIEQYKAHRLMQKAKSTGKNIGRRTINRELSYLAKYLNYCGSTLTITKFRKKDCEPPPPEPLSMDDMDKIVALLPYPIKQLVQLMEYNGLRRNEAMNLKSIDAAKDGSYVRVWGKGGKWRVAPIELKELQERIKGAKKVRPSGYLFPNLKTMLPYKDIRRQLKSAVEKAEVSQRVYNHLFRHSFATALVEGGENLAVIQELMGHADIKQTRNYIKLVTSHTRRGAAKLVDRDVAKVATHNSK